MSNGNDEPNVPRPSSSRPEDENSESGAKTSAGETEKDSVETSTPESTPPSAPNDSQPNDGEAGEPGPGESQQSDSQQAESQQGDSGRWAESTPDGGAESGADDQSDTVSMSLSDRQEAAGPEPEEMRLSDRQAEPETLAQDSSAQGRQESSDPDPHESDSAPQESSDSAQQKDDSAPSTEALPQAPSYDAPQAPSYPPTAPTPQAASYPDDQAPPFASPSDEGQNRFQPQPPGSDQPRSDRYGSDQPRSDQYGAPDQGGLPPYPSAGPSQGGPHDAQGPPPGGPAYGGPQHGGPQSDASPYAPYGGPQNAQHGGPQGPQPGGPQNAQYGAAQGPQYGGPQQSPVPQQTGSGGPGHSQSIPQPAPAPGFAGGATATRADSRPRNKKKGRLPLFIALGSVLLVLVLVAVGFLVINSVNKNNYGPDKVAEEYVAALSKGDFAAAEKIAPSPRPEGTNLDLLSKDFTEGSAAKVSNAKVESSTVDGDNGKVLVSYELDGSSYQVELPAKKEGKQDLFFDKWTLTGPALHVISLDIPAADGMTVNGNDYQAQAGTTSFAVYPGSYEFKIPASKWVGEASDTAEVNFPQAFAPGEKPSNEQVAPLTLNLSLSPTDAFQKEVQKQVEDELKKCFDNKDIKPKCEFINFDPTEIPVGGTDDKLADLAKKDTAKWTIKDMPKVKASFGVGDSSTGSFFTDKQGSFDFSVDGKQRGSSYFSNGNPLSVSGSVKIDGDKLSIEFFDF